MAHKRRPRFAPRYKYYCGMVVQSGVVILTASVVLGAAPILEKSAALDGTWTIPGGTIVSIVGSAGHIEARVVAPSAHSRLDLGWRSGDLMWKGTVTDTQIVGIANTRYPLALKDKCLNAAETELPLELQLVSSTKLLGRHRSRIIREDCSEGGELWIPVEWTRKSFEVAETDNEISITWVDGILFDFDRAELKVSAISTLRDAKALVIDPQPHVRITVEGHTDDRGSVAYNQDLSSRRARAVESWLLNSGVPSEAMSAKGFGMTRPEVPNSSDANRARNRRVEIRLEKPTIPEEPSLSTSR